MSDAWIMIISVGCRGAIRLKQISGLADLFKDKDFSTSFETFY
jgi:hypothetical protein